MPTRSCRGAIYPRGDGALKARQDAAEAPHISIGSTLFHPFCASDEGDGDVEALIGVSPPSRPWGLDEPSLSSLSTAASWSTTGKSGPTRISRRPRQMVSECPRLSPNNQSRLTKSLPLSATLNVPTPSTRSRGSARLCLVWSWISKSSGQRIDATRLPLPGPSRSRATLCHSQPSGSIMPEIKVFSKGKPRTAMN